jgi:hypothetical protein
MRRNAIHPAPNSKVQRPALAARIGVVPKGLALLCVCPKGFLTQRRDLARLRSRN